MKSFRIEGKSYIRRVTTPKREVNSGRSQIKSNFGNYLLDRLEREAHNRHMQAPKTLQDAITMR